MIENQLQHIKRVLIANRGEIVSRIMKTAHAMGIETVVVYAEDDCDMNYVRDAQVSVYLGKGTLSATYLNASKIVDIAKQHHVDAIHPGYGFLSEDASFAQQVVDAGLIWVGPESTVIEKMGNKIKAKKAAQEIGIPVVTSFFGSKDKLRTLQNIHFPVLIKPANGGGGKGMRVVDKQDGLAYAMERTAEESVRYFGDDSVFIEQFIRNPRHIEVQVLADHQGNVVHLYDRECSIQRRYQKLIEEAPAPFVEKKVREQMLEAAIALVKAVGYTNAGTVEFLLADDGAYYFMEMNTRLQVEHTVTEEVTGMDMVSCQLRIADGQPLGFEQKDIQVKKHAIELRLNAEDAEHNFTPAVGTLDVFRFPSNCRLETSFGGGSVVGTAYDALLAKIIVAKSDRHECIHELNRVLNKTAVHGVLTNSNFLGQVIHEKDFLEGKVSTTWLDAYVLNDKKELPSSLRDALIASYVIARLNYKESAGPINGNVWSQIGYWRSFYRMRLKIAKWKTYLEWRVLSDRKVIVQVGEKHLILEHIEHCDNNISFYFNQKWLNAVWSKGNGRDWNITVEGKTFTVEEEMVSNKIIGGHNNTGGKKSIVSPLPGKVLKINTKEGARVKKGDALLIIESMKMENNVIAEFDALVKGIRVKEGQQLQGKEVLLDLDNN